MKQLIFILFSFIILSCNQNHKKDDLLGTWDFVSSTDIETGEITLPESDDAEFVEFKSDSLYLSSDIVFAWQIKGDSIFLDEFGSVYIKELTGDKLIVEYDFFFGEARVTFRRRK